MAAFYSILSVLIRPELQEKISLGLLLFDSDRIFFNYSKNKLIASKSLLNDDSYRLLIDSIKNIKSKAISENDLLGSKSSIQLTIHDEMLLNSFSASYISYLSKYSNNILSFTEPKEINLEVSDDIFKKLFSKFIDAREIDITGLPQSKQIDIFKEKNLARLERYFNIDTKVTSREIPNLIMPVKVDLLGENGVPVYVKSIDMDRRVYDIEYDIGILLSLNTAFNQNKQKAKGFVLAQEPTQNDSEKYAIWNELRKEAFFDYVDVSESEKILEYAENNKVHPLIKEADKENEEDV